MNLIRKLGTAKRVLLRYGPRDVLGLLWANVSRVVRRHSRRLVSKTLRLFPAGRRGTDARLHILYVTALQELEIGQTCRYRIFNLRHALRPEAASRFEVLENGIYRDDRALRWADILVLMRTHWTPQAQELADRARRLSIPVVFDIDDIIFLEEYAPLFCRALNDPSEETQEIHRAGFASFRRLFDRCDFATASTEFIAGKMRQLGKTAFVIPNGLNRAQLRIASRVLRRPPRREIRYIGYMSGTRTHDRDLMQAVPALTRIVREHDDVRFRLVGFADESLLPRELREKTDTAFFMKWTRLLRFTASNTVNIAPLDVDNPFCHAKSELKYFESAVVGVPTVASQTDTFRRCIRDGENGLLASGEEEWYAALRRLLDDGEAYRSIREAAMRDARDRYSPPAIARTALAAYRAILSRYAGKGQPPGE